MSRSLLPEVLVAAAVLSLGFLVSATDGAALSLTEFEAAPGVAWIADDTPIREREAQREARR